MFCRNCGKQIEEDSVFCKYCGENVAPRNSFFQNKGFSTRFFELPKKKQIATITYGIWFLGWFSFLIANADSCINIDYDTRHFAEDYFFPFFLCTIVIPYIILGGRHIYKMTRKKDKNTNSPNNEVYSVKSHIQAEKIISSESLLSFAKNNGKMQVVSKTIADGYYEHYCLFTAEDGKVTRVDFTERTGRLSSKEISEMKQQLSVNKLADGTYRLDFI